MTFILAAIVSFFASFVIVPIALKILQALGFYTIVEERTCIVFMLFGKVIGVLNEPGLHFLWLELGPRALLPARGLLAKRLVRAVQPMRACQAGVDASRSFGRR